MTAEIDTIAKLIVQTMARTDFVAANEGANEIVANKPGTLRGECFKDTDRAEFLVIERVTDVAALLHHIDIMAGHAARLVRFGKQVIEIYSAVPATVLAKLSQTTVRAF
ncbi:hypothetical protein LX81_03081 [Palleronia aestuarii]|uniref:Antibiotic biosynthesis monooxygenase n=1 Tax=Palleronia aestuarii TaxID=568105 RepID=A0A2W7N626_9RHOB|nr:hypothetical protein [Palleronia aestuarii]PZX13747.1 hypothetical protein LX81_03081 [Palleronia aestuarii]